MCDKRKRTNTNQFAKLVELMEKNPDIAKGIGAFGSSKKNQKDYWEQFAVELNSLGPPSREGKDWHKVWLDYKLKLKQKISSNKKNVTATGGGPYSQIVLSPLEQAVDDLLSLNQAVNPLGNRFGPNIQTTLPETELIQKSNSQSDEFEDIQKQLNEIFQEEILTEGERTQRGQASVPNNSNATEGEHGQGASLNKSSLQSRKKVMNLNRRESERLELLKGQTDTQADLLVVARSIEKNISEIARYTRKEYEIQKEKLNIMKEKEKRKEKENIEKSRRHKEKIEIKLKKIEIEMKRTI